MMLWGVLFTPWLRFLEENGGTRDFTKPIFLVYQKQNRGIRGVPTFPYIRSGVLIDKSPVFVVLLDRTRSNVDLIQKRVETG